MCGRFSQHYTWQEIHDAMDLLGTPGNQRARYNIAPTTTVDIVLTGDDGRQLESARWGLVPAWWKKPLKELPATFNARAETVSEKPMFRSAYKTRRCIVPASGYYEWTGKAGTKVPHYFTAADGSPVLAIAGLWERWRDGEGEDAILSTTMVIRAANDWMTGYHDRMPVLLTPSMYGGWLDGSLAVDAIPVTPEAALREWVVSPAVNRTGVGDDDPATIAKVTT